MSTGAKLLFACLGVTVVGIMGLAVAVAVGGFALKRGVESALGTVEEQQEATDMLRRIEEEHPFDPPDDGVVGERRLSRFLAVTETAWDDIQPFAEDLDQLREAARTDRRGLSGLRDVASGARAIGGMVRARVQLAEALDAHDMSLGEYVWTGIQLERAMDAAEGGRPAESVPDANLALARSHGDDIPRFDSDEDEAMGPEVVLAVATIWGMADLSAWQALGLDTLAAR